MIYVLYGLENYLINKEIKKILKNNSIDDFSTEKYDLENNLLDNILESANMNNLFGDKKGIIINNAYIFTGTTKKGVPEHNIDLFDKYLDNPNSDTILIFVSNSDKLDERKKIVKKIKANGNVLEFNVQDNLSGIVKTFFDGYKIDSKTINLFIDRVGSNLALLESEAEKLKVYKFDKKAILENDVMDTINKNIELDIFNLIDKIVLKKKNEAIVIYNEMLKHGEEPIKIMIMLASQFRIMYQIKLMYKKGYNEKDMASVLAIHPYRVKLGLEKSKKFTEEFLLKLLDELAVLDSKIKRSEVDKKMALELFILKI